MKVLNLYAGIGGNRRLWPNNIEVTAVEKHPEIAKIYSDFFPQDTLIVGDAHAYLPDHFKEYDFIWSSCPCQTHSSFRYNLQVGCRGAKPEYPDMRLWQEIVFLKYHCKTKWVVENVNPYYDMFIPGQLIQRHVFWANFYIDQKSFESENIRAIQIPQLQKIHGFDLAKYSFEDKDLNKRQILRNCVLPELGLHVFDCAFKKVVPQLLLFNSEKILNKKES